MNESQPVLEIPARRITVPTWISPEAQAWLSREPMEQPEFPSLDDTEGWRRWAADSEAGMLAFLAQMPGVTDAELTDVDGVGVYIITPNSAAQADPRVCLELHGGGFVTGAGICCAAMGQFMASRLGLQTWAVDYRMPPDYPYPAALDDCMIAYSALLERYDASRIVFDGASAGGNLVAALALRARDEGLPLPAAILMLSPAADLTGAGDSFQTNFGVDTTLPRNIDTNTLSLLYAGGHDTADPYVSPLYGDFSKGFPPTLLASGTRDLLLSNAVRMHRALRSAGVTADLHLLEAGPHQLMAGTPEDEDLQREILQFVNTHCPPS